MATPVLHLVLECCYCWVTQQRVCVCGIVRSIVVEGFPVGGKPFDFFLCLRQC